MSPSTIHTGTFNSETGYVDIKVTVQLPGGKQLKNLRGFIDSGATMSVIRKHILEQN
jgi:hypothetical protein